MSKRLTDTLGMDLRIGFGVCNQSYIHVIVRMCISINLTVRIKPYGHMYCHTIVNVNILIMCVVYVHACQQYMHIIM